MGAWGKTKCSLLVLCAKVRVTSGGNRKTVDDWKYKPLYNNIQHIQCTGGTMT